MIEHCQNKIKTSLGKSGPLVTKKKEKFENLKKIIMFFLLIGTLFF